MKKLAVFLALFLSAFFIIPVRSVSPAQVFLDPKPRPKIAFTFDDGPRPAAVHHLRTVLNRHGIVATFFVVGQMAARYPEAVRKLFNDGHEIANHSFSHPDIELLTPHEIKDELDTTRRLIQEITGVNTWIFRTPGSTRSYLTQRFEVPDHYTLALWDVHSQDHLRPSPEEIVQSVVSNVQDGDIVLFHTGVPETVEALDCIIPELKARGFEFVDISTMLVYRRLRLKLSSRPVSIIRG